MIVHWTFILEDTNKKMFTKVPLILLPRALVANLNPRPANSNALET